MRRSILACLLLLAPLAALAGCAGYAADYWRPRLGILADQLTRYGFDESQARCAGRRLADGLTVWQLRQLERIARLVPQGQFGRAALTPADLLRVAGHVQDQRVRPEVAAAVEACAPPPPPPVLAVEPEPMPAAPLWLNLGAAPSGQSIAVNASSISEQGGTREGWFRLTAPGARTPGDIAYLLRIDCAARTINALATRRHGPDGAIVQEHDFRPAGEGVTPVDGGTVMEIAYLALCT